MFLKPGILLRIEGALALALGVFLYRSAGAALGVLLLAFLVARFVDDRLSGLYAAWFWAIQRCSHLYLPLGAGGSVFNREQDRTIVLCADLDLAHRI